MIRAPHRLVVSRGRLDVLRFPCDVRLGWVVIVYHIPGTPAARGESRSLDARRREVFRIHAGRGPRVDVPVSAAAVAAGLLMG